MCKKFGYVLLLVLLLVSAGSARAGSAAGPQFGASVTLTKLTQVYDGTQKSAACETTPVGLTTAITYKSAGAGTGRINAGNYWVTCEIKHPIFSASETATMVIAQADQTIAFDAIDDRTMGDAPFDVTVSVSSGLPVSLTSHTPDVCAVTGTTVALVHDGICTLEAGHPGDFNHTAAPAVERSFAVVPAGPALDYLVAYDSALQDDWNLAIWEDSSHHVAANPDAPAPGGRAGNAIEVQFSPNGYGAFGLANMRDWNSIHYMYLNEIKTIQFDLYVDPDTTGLENLMFILEDASFSNQPQLVKYIGGWDPAHPEASYGRWLHISIDLEHVGATIPRFARFLFWNGAANSSPHFRMANVRLGWQDDPTPAVITLESIAPGLTYNTLALAFSTDRDAIYRVEYGTGDYANVITGDPAAWRRNHALTLSGLSRGHTYQYRITVWNHHMDPEAPPTPSVLLGGYTMPAVPTTPPVIAAFTATPEEISVGSSARLTWSAADYDTLTIDHGVGTVSLVPGATGVLVSPSATTTYTMTAANALGSVTKTVTLVTHDVPGVSLFTATPRKIGAGAATTLTWNVADAGTISIDHGIGDVTAVPGAAGVVVSPTETTTYVLTAVNAYGTVRQTATVTIASADTNPVWVLGYYVGYHRTIQRPDQIDYSTMTHIIVGAAVPGMDGSLDTSFYTGGEAAGHAWANETVQRAHAAGRKALLMLGGAGAIAGFQATASPAVRASFVANVKAFVEECGFDGVDVDWEPIDIAADGQTVLALLDALQAPGALPRSSYVYTLPVGWNNKNFDPMADPFYGTVSAYFDRVSTMSYTMLWIGDGWETWHSSPLYGQTDNAPSSIDDTVRALRAAGVPDEKLGIGIGFYGTAYENGGWSSSAGAYVHQNPPEIPDYATAPHQSTAHVFSRYGDNQVSYSNIMQYLHRGTAYRWDEAARVPYLSWESPAQFNYPGVSDMQTTYVTYDDEQAIAEKGAYVRKNGLGAVMIWTISQGYLGSWKTTGELDPLMKAVWLAFKQ